MNKSKRIFYYDFLRAMAIVGIVFCHASISFVTTGIHSPYFHISAFFDCFRDFCIPIFVMLSGALLIGKKDSFIDFFKKRLSRIFIPFIFWLIIYILYSFYFIIHRIDVGNAIDILFGAPGTLGVTFWFIWMITVCYFGIFIINKILDFGAKRFDDFEVNFINILAVLAVLLICIYQFWHFKTIYGYFCSFMIYIILGYFLATRDYLARKINVKYIVIATAIIFLGLYNYYIFAYVVPNSILNNNFTYLGYFTCFLFILAITVFLLFKYLSKTELFDKIENNRFGELITFISKYSFGIYLAHYLILIRLRTSIIRFVNFNQQNPLIWIPLFVILTLAISVGILWCLSKIPYLNKVSGIS